MSHSYTLFGNAEYLIVDAVSFSNILSVIVRIQVLPVMIMGAFIPGLRRKYPIHEYISAMLLVVGLILFTLADAHTSPNFSIFGVVMITGALVMDAFLGNFQEAIFTMNPDTTQVTNSSLGFMNAKMNHDQSNKDCFYFYLQFCVIFQLTDGDAILLDCCRVATFNSTNDTNRRAD